MYQPVLRDVLVEVTEFEGIQVDDELVEDAIGDVEEGLRVCEAAGEHQHLTLTWPHTTLLPGKLHLATLGVKRKRLSA